MSVTENGWGEVERRAREQELVQAFGLPLVKIEVADRLRGCIVESLSMLEAGHTAAAQQILEDALKIRGEL